MRGVPGPAWLALSCLLCVGLAPGRGEVGPPTRSALLLESMMLERPSAASPGWDTMGLVEGSRRARRSHFDDCACPGSCTVQTASYGSLSDGSGEGCPAINITGRYQNGWSCHWTIAPPGADALFLSFPSFALKVGADVVQVFSCTTVACGTKRPLSSPLSVPAPHPDLIFNSTTGIIRVEFTTNSYWTDMGFWMRWGVRLARACGDGFRDALKEDCDDGNSNDGDGCSASCRVESGWNCTGGNRTTADNCFRKCYQEMRGPSGSGMIWSPTQDYAPHERCEWVLAPAGASNLTVLFHAFDTEPGHDAVTLTCCSNASLPGLRCGDPAAPVLPSGGNASAAVVLSGSGPAPGTAFTCGTGVARLEFRSNGCREERGFRFAFLADAREGSCGDGVRQPNEECDVGSGGGPGSGCDHCVVETGFVCTVVPNSGDSCTATCGDGVQASSEECDDGNQVAGDGCSASCTCEHTPCSISIGPSQDLVSILATISAGSTISLASGAYDHPAKHRHLVVKNSNIKVVGAGNSSAGTVFCSGLMSSLRVASTSLSFQNLSFANTLRIFVADSGGLELASVGLDSVYIEGNHAAIMLRDLVVKRKADVDHGVHLVGDNSSVSVTRVVVHDEQDGHRMILQGNNSTFSLKDTRVQAVDTAGHCVVMFGSSSRVSIDSCDVLTCWANFNNAGFLPEGGGLRFQGPKLQVRLKDTNVMDCGADKAGSAMYMDSYHGRFTMEGGVMSGNMALTEIGMGVFGEGGQVDLIDATFKDNVAYVGDGSGFAMKTRAGSLAMQGVTFTNNFASSRGAGFVSLDEDSTITIANSSFSGNSAGTHGGGAFVRGSSVTVTHSSFIGNQATGRAGGLHAHEAAQVNLSSCAFNRNVGSYGAAVFVNGSSLTVVDSNFAENTASKVGAGIWYSGLGSSVLRVSGSNFTLNGALQGGGAIAAVDARVHLDFDHFDNNTADANGGGIDCLRCRAMVTGCSFSNNKGSMGGGLGVRTNPELHQRRTITTSVTPGIIFGMSRDGSRVYQRGEGSSGNAYDIFSTGVESLEFKDLTGAFDAADAPSSANQDRSGIVMALSDDDTVAVLFRQMENLIVAVSLSDQKRLAEISALFWTQRSGDATDNELLIPGIVQGNANRDAAHGWGLCGLTTPDKIYTSTYWTTQIYDITSRTFTNLPDACGSQVTAMVSSRELDKIWMARYDGSAAVALLWVYDIATKTCTQPAWKIPPLFAAVRSITVSDDGMHVFVAERAFFVGESTDQNMNEDVYITAVQVEEGIFTRLTEYNAAGDIVPIVIPLVVQMLYQQQELVILGLTRQTPANGWYRGPFNWELSGVSIGSLQISDCVLSGNTATERGGGLYIDGTSHFAPATKVTGLVATGNTADKEGGAVWLSRCANPAVLDSGTLTGNVAKEGGGGLAASFSSSVTLSRMTISGNTAGTTATGNAGAVLFVSQLTSGAAGAGSSCLAAAASYPNLPGSQLTIRDCIIANNKGNGVGSTGAVTLQGTSVGHFAGTVMSGNEAYTGAALSVMESSTAWIGNTTMNGNRASDCGGAVALGSLHAIRVISSLTIRENLSRRDGGGLCLLYIPSSDRTDRTCVQGVVPPFLVDVRAGGSLTLQNNTATKGGGGVFARCLQPPAAFQGVMDSVRQRAETSAGSWQFLNNEAGYGPNVATQAQDLKLINGELNAYMPGDPVASKLRLADGFGQTVALRDEALSFIVVVRVCKGLCSQGGEELIKAYQGFRMDGVCNQLTTSVPILWPAQTLGGERVFDSALSISHEIAELVDDVEMAPSELEIVRIPCEAGFSYSEERMMCLPCLATEYIFRPNFDLCQPCALGGMCDGKGMVGMVIRSDSSFAECKECKWEVENGQILRLTECPKGFVLVRDPQLPTLDQCVACPVGKVSTEPARWEGRVMVSQSASRAADQCRECAYWKTCDGGSHEGPLDFEIRLPAVPVQDGRGGGRGRQRDPGSETTCLRRMSVCGTTQQGIPVDFEVFDNKGGSNITLNYTLWQGTIIASGYAQEKSPNVWTLPVSTVERGTHVMEIFVDGELLPNCPFLFRVLERDCSQDGENRVANDAGECVCVATSLDVFGRCVAMALLLPLIIIPTILLFACIVMYLAVLKVRKADCDWNIKLCELKFSDPVEILGRGTFGMVVKANLRGTEVAVKRVRPSDFSNSARKPPHNSKSNHLSNHRLSAAMEHMQGSDEQMSKGYEHSRGRMASMPLTGQSPFSQDKNASGSPLSAVTSTVKPSSSLFEHRAASFQSSSVSERSFDGASGSPINRNRSQPLGRMSRQLVVEEGSEASHQLSVELPLPSPWPSGKLNTKHNTEDDLRELSCGSHGHGMSSQVSAASRPGPPGPPRQLRLRIPMVQSGHQTVWENVDSLRSRRGSYPSVTSGSSLWCGLPWPWLRHKMEQRRQMTKLENEMRQLCKLRHPSIVTAMAAIIQPGEEFLMVMELMGLGSLCDLLHNASFPFEDEMVDHILADIVLGISFLHSAQPPVIHGDLKAANVLIDTSMRAKVADFGFTKKRQLGAYGTPFWMSPEQLAGAEPSVKTDCYAFGILLYEIFSRQLPFEDEDVTSVLWKVVDTDRMPPYRPKVPANCPVKARDVMVKCWRNNPLERPSFETIEWSLSNIDESRWKKSAMFSLHEAIKKKTDVLHGVFPPHIAKALVRGEKVQPEEHAMCTVLFMDIVGFTTLSQKVSPSGVVDLLDRFFGRLDHLCELHGVWKLETIGDAYIGVTNLVHDQSKDHAAIMARFAADALAVSRSVLISESDPSMGSVKIRIGLNSGPLVANVVGKRNPKWTIFGDTVNLCSRMESTSSAGRAQVTEETANLIREQDPTIQLTKRGEVAVKGRDGKHITFWIAGGNTTSLDEVPNKARRSSGTNSAPRVSVDGRSEHPKPIEVENDVVGDPVAGSVHVMGLEGVTVEVEGGGVLS